MGGNHVYIKIDKTGTYLLLNHLKKGSVLVKTGDHVSEGDIIGRVGNSGTTSEPHLHIQHQRQDPTKIIYPIFAEGLPLYFKDINGESMPKKGSIIIPED
jgi:murein DD-endopeptidase MepM/ murein hydrolase activator NlpD